MINKLVLSNQQWIKVAEGPIRVLVTNEGNTTVLVTETPVQEPPTSSSIPSISLTTKRFGYAEVVVDLPENIQLYARDPGDQDAIIMYQVV